jgi:hypothetical protein
MEPTIFQKLLGHGFSGLPEQVRALHGIRGRVVYAGRASIQRGPGVLARLCATIAGLPPAMHDAPVSVEFIADDEREIWNRDFGGNKMSSSMTLHGGRLLERLGPILFEFNLRAHQGEILWTVHAVRLFGMLPLPTQLFRGVRCREREVEGRYEFLVEASLPIAGSLVRYEGWLEAV